MQKRGIKGDNKMIRQTGYNPKCTASCDNCERIEECVTRDNLRHPTIVFCDYAKEGCTHYSGPGDQDVRLPTFSLIRKLKKGQVLNEVKVLETYSCGRSRYLLAMKRIQEIHELVLTEDGYKLKHLPKPIKKK